MEELLQIALLPLLERGDVAVDEVRGGDLVRGRILAAVAAEDALGGGFDDPVLLGAQHAQPGEDRRRYLVSGGLPREDSPDADRERAPDPPSEETTSSDPAGRLISINAQTRRWAHR